MCFPHGKTAEVRKKGREGLLGREEGFWRNTRNVWASEKIRGRFRANETFFLYISQHNFISIFQSWYIR